MAFSRPKYDIPCSHFFLKKPMHCNTLKSLLIQSFSPVTVTTNPVLSKSLSTTNTSSSQLNFLRILLAEDNVMNQRVIKKILESIGTFLYFIFPPKFFFPLYCCLFSRQKSLKFFSRLSRNSHCIQRKRSFLIC